MSNLSSLFDRYKALVIFDTETSGLNPGDDQIIELAALRVERTQTGALRIAGKMDTFIKLPEGEKLPENIVTLTGITDDRCADWAIRKIAEERSEYNRLKELADQQKAAIEEKVEAARRRMENGTAFLTSCLADFFNTVPHKTTKTTEKYRLLSGTLTLKKGTVKATVDDAKLVPWLRENGYGDLVKVEESAKWGELKKLLAYTGEIATIQSTGEIVEGVTAYETPATFTVDI